MTTKFNNAAFVTLTYARDAPSGLLWQRVSKDTNRYIQRLRRAGLQLEYLRAFEQHKDGYPHVHILFLESSQKCLRERGKFLHDKWYRLFKSSWVHGLSDAQSPKYQNKGVVGYILKYLNKSTSSNTLWSKILEPNLNIQPTKVSELGYPLKPPPGENVWQSVLVPENHTLLYTTLTWKRVKLLMWSRNFPSELRKSLKP